MKRTARSAAALLLAALMLFSCSGGALALSGESATTDSIIETTIPSETTTPESAETPEETQSPVPESTEEPAEMLPGAPEAVLRRAFAAPAVGGGHRLLLSGSHYEYVAVLDYDGGTLWSLEQADLGWNEINDADLLPNGNLVMAVSAPEGCYVCLLTPDYAAKSGYELLWRYEVPAGAENHTCQPIDQNGFLVGEAYGDHIRLVELDAQGDVRKTLDTPDMRAVFDGAGGTHGQLRQVHKNPDGTYLLTHFSKPVTLLLNEDGTLKKQYGVGAGFTSALDKDGNVVISGGDTHVITCLNAETGEQVWQLGQTDVAGGYLGFAAAIHPLPNGNLVLANWGGHGSAGGAAVMELDPVNKALVWKADDKSPLVNGQVSNVQVLDGMFDEDPSDGDDFYRPVIDPEPPEYRPDNYRSPLAAVSSVVTGLVYVADQTGCTISVIRSATDKVLQVIELEKVPNALLLSPDARRLYIAAGGRDGAVYVLDTAANKILDTVYAAGHTPSALALSGGALFVANRFNGTVQKIDLASGASSESAFVTREPVAMELAGGTLYVAGHLPDGAIGEGTFSSRIVPVDPGTLAVGAPIQLANGSTGLKDLALSPDGTYLYAAHTLGRYEVATTHGDRGWIYTNAVSEIRVSDNTVTATMMVDDVDRGASNPWGIAATTDKLILTASGTRELLIINRTLMRQRIDSVADGSGTVAGYLDTVGDITNDLSFLTPFKKRIDLGEDGPRGLTLLGGKVYTANYYGGSVSVYNVNSGALKTIMLDSGREEDDIRAGERLWNDATFGFQQWQSCASCHPDGRVDALNWDNLNDGIGTPKQARTMVDSWTRGRVMATGIRPDAYAAVRAGIKFIMFNGTFIAEHPDQVEQLDAYVESLQPDYSPYLVDGALSEAALRGEAIFDGKAGCASCHAGPNKGQDKLYYDNYTQNPVDTRGLLVPPLREVWRTAPYLHDGSAATIMDVLTTRNAEDKHGKVSALSETELADLCEYVLSIGPAVEAQTFSISGKVKTDTAIAVGGLTVELYAAEDTAFETLLASTTTQENGSFLLEGMTAGSYTLRIAGVKGSYTECLKLVTMHSDVTGVELELRAEAPSTYRITAAPVGGVTVSLSAAEAEAGALITVTLTDLGVGKKVTDVSVVLADDSFPATAAGSGTYTFVMPNQDATVAVTLAEIQTLAEAKAAVEAALSGYQATNNTDAAAVKALAGSCVVSAAISVEVLDFVRTDATESAMGHVTARIVLTLGGAAEEIALSKEIDKLPSEPSYSGGTSLPRSTVTNDAITKSTIIKPVVTEENGEATANINSSEIGMLVTKAKQGESSSVVVRPKVSDGIGRVTVKLPSGGAMRLGEETGADLIVETPFGNMTVRNDVLKTVSGSLMLTMEKKSDGRLAVEASKNTAILVTLPVENSSAGTVAVIIGADGAEDVVEKSKVVDGQMWVPLAGSAVIEIRQAGGNFQDLSAAWYRDGVTFVTARGLFRGTAEGVFSPGEPMSRGMVVTVLHRLENSPAAARRADFTDVPADSWYTAAVDWAVEAGVASGRGSGTFQPDAAVTRQELAVILYHYAKVCGAATDSVQSELDAADASQVAPWAAEAMRYAVSAGLFTGKTGNLLDPTGTATRAEIAVLLQRFVEKVL